MSANKHVSRYEITVFADSAAEAIEVAAEALPRDAKLAASKADPVPGAADPSWHVVLNYSGGSRRSSDAVG